MRRPQTIVKEKWRILVIDDEPFLLRMETDMLLDMGYDVIAFGDGVEAMKLFSANPYAFDLVITDQTMPGMTGTQVARKINAMRPGLPIILYTGTPDVGHEEAQGSSIGWIVQKPFSTKDWSGLLRQILDKE